MKLTRRSLTFGALGVGGAAALAGGGLLTVLGTASVESVVRRRLDYLNFAPGSLKQFGDAFRAAHPSRSNIVSRALAAPQKAVRAMFHEEAALSLLEDRICSEFLMSSDFFQNGADTARPVSFLAYADPYTASCSNPIVVIDPT